MKKRTAAIMLSVTLTAATLGGTTLHGYATQNDENNETATLEIAGEEKDALTKDYSVVSTTDLVSTEEISETPAFSYSNVADVAEAAMPSIVSITNKSVQEINSYFFGGFRDQGYQYESESAGSGFIIGSNDDELLICTNNHVVENATELSVTFIDETSCTAYIKGTDADNDLAVVAVNLEDIPDETMDQIRISRIGDSESMRVGEQVVAIGNALGYGQSVTTGIISAKNRSIQASTDGYNVATYDGLIQTDAAINFGNSGGALLNMNGEVIGINSAKASSSVENMGYAIPLSKAMPILETLMTRKTRVKLDADQIGYLGINGQSVSSEATMLYGIPKGIYVTYVSPDSPAAAGGLEEGDIITAFDGEGVTSIKDLQNCLQYYAAGETVDVTVCKGNDSSYKEETISVTLGNRSEIQ